MEIDSVERLRPVRSLVLPASALAGGGQAHPARRFEAVSAGRRLGGVLLAIRNHLERQVPLDLEVRVQVEGSRLERWRVQGSVERNAAGQPISLGGTMREVSAGLPDPP